MMARAAAASLLLALLAVSAFAAESYEAKEEYNHAPAPHAKKAAYGHSFESVCLQEVENSCDLGFAINLDLCDLLALRYYSNFECCKALTGTPAQIASSRAKHASQLLKLYGNTDACRWDFTFGVDILNLILDKDVSGIDSPGVLPFGKAVATCYFSEDLHHCGPFCNGMQLKAESDMFLTWGVSPDGKEGCALDNFRTRAQSRVADKTASKSTERALAFLEQLEAAAQNMTAVNRARHSARRADVSAAKDAPESYESREYVNPPAYSYKSHHYDPLSGGVGSFPIGDLHAGIFAIFSGSFTGSVNGVKDEELQGEFSFTPLFFPVEFFTDFIPFYLDRYPNLPFSRAGQLNFRFAHEAEEGKY